MASVSVMGVHTNSYSVKPDVYRVRVFSGVGGKVWDFHFATAPRAHEFAAALREDLSGLGTEAAEAVLTVRKAGL